MPSNKPVVVSFPRCGRTWLLEMIGFVICSRDNVDFSEAILERIKYVDATHDGTDKSKRIHLKNMPTSKIGYSDKRVLFLARDPRDVVVSAFLHATQRKGSFKGTLKEFIRDPRFGIEKIVHFYNIWYENREIPRSLKVIWYENLVKDTSKTLREAVDFLGIDWTEENIKDAVIAGRLENLRNWERVGFLKRGTGKPKNPQNIDSYYHRKGKIGGWKEYLDYEDVEFCQAAISKLKFRKTFEVN